jgi:hypothetical protein
VETGGNLAKTRRILAETGGCRDMLASADSCGNMRTRAVHVSTTILGFAIDYYYYYCSQQ